MGYLKFKLNLFHLFILTLFVFCLIISFVDAVPNGVSNITVVNISTANPTPPQSLPAQAGNVTEMNVVGYSTTQSWQGYFGNVTGSIQLSNGANNVIFNWSAASPKGQIYATTNNSVSWAYVQCFNFSAMGNYSSDLSFAGNTSKYGMNVTQLESLYNITVNDSDGVNETFTRNDHVQFYANSYQFTNGECKNAKLYNASGQGVFDEVLLYSPDSRSVIFASILRDNALGFDNRTHDFEMLVLEDGHYTDISTTPYYFYIELT